MPAEFTLSTAAKSAMGNAMLDLLDAGVAAGRMELQGAGEVVLASVPLAYPCGAVDVAGKLSFTPTDAAASVAVGTVVKAVFKDSTGATVFSSNVSLKTGDAFVRLNSLTINEVGQLVRISVGEMTY